MSVQFDPPKGLNLAHLGAFWATQKSSLPHVRVGQPISTPNETFGNQGPWLPPVLRLALTNDPDCRLQMISSDDQWMFQVQRDRIVINWRKRTDSYPRYDATWQRFQRAWKEWQAFVRDSGFARATPSLWELTYVNRIGKENCWTSPSDWPKVFPGLWGKEFSPVGDVSFGGFQGQWMWETTDRFARLYVESKPARSTDRPARDVLLLTLTARGAGSFDEGMDDDLMLNSIGEGMTRGHDLIVTTFDRMASAEAKQIWGRHANSD